MNTPQALIDSERLEEARRAKAASGRSSDGGSSGGPGGGDELEHRVAALEKGFDKIDGKLDKILAASAAIDVRLTAIETKLETKASTLEVAKVEGHIDTLSAKLDAKASAEMVGTMKGRLDSLPTTWQMIALVFTILGGAFLILKFGLPHAP